MRAYLELRRQKNQIEGMKFVLEATNTAISCTSKLVCNNIVYDFDFAEKILDSDFATYLEYIEKADGFDNCVEKLATIKTHGSQEGSTQTFFQTAIVKEFDVGKLDLIISKIRKSLGKNKLLMNKELENLGE